MKISDTEWLVMRVVWRKKVASAADVIESLLPETGWSHRTVRTLLARLVEKGALETERDGQRYLYRPTTTQKQCVREEGQSFLEKVFGGDAGELLVHFFKNEEIAPDQIEQLRKMLDEKTKKRQG